VPRTVSGLFVVNSLTGGIISEPLSRTRIARFAGGRLSTLPRFAPDRNGYDSVPQADRLADASELSGLLEQTYVNGRVGLMKEVVQRSAESIRRRLRRAAREFGGGRK
jgi:hypothetical protein